MNLRLPALALLLSTSPMLGAQDQAKPVAKAAPVKPKRNMAPRQKPLELNLATKSELMKLPGITEDLAAKIIAGRPYLTKTNLVTRNILPLDHFASIKPLISARQAPAAK